MEMTESANAELFERLNEGKVIQLTPKGISMLPFIQGGRDKVRIHKEESVSVGDIVLAPHDGRLILHRVYDIKGNRLTLMGDGNLKGNMASQGTTPRQLTDLIGSLCDLTSGSGDKGTPVVLVQGYFDNYTND